MGYSIEGNDLDENPNQVKDDEPGVDEEREAMDSLNKPNTSVQNARSLAPKIVDYVMSDLVTFGKIFY